MSEETNELLTTLLHLFDELDIEDQEHVASQIGARVKENRDAHRVALMGRFHPGDEVTFLDKHAMPRHATVLRTNKKTVSLLTHDDERCNVAPELLTPAAAPDTPRVGQDRRWVAGMATMPAFVTGESGDNYQPLAAMVLNEVGQVVGLELFDPNDTSFDIVRFLEQTIADPQAGPAVAPSHLKISEKRWLLQLQAAFPTIKVSVGVTSEIDEVMGAMQRDMPAPNKPVVYSSIGADPRVVESYFSSVAALYESKPWKSIPHDQCLISVTSEELGLRDAVVSVIGKENTSFGIVLFDSLADHEHYTLWADEMEHGQDPGLPSHRSLLFESAAEISPETRKDIARHQWTVAGPNAYPTLLIPTSDRMLKPPSERDLEVFDAVAQLVTSAFKNRTFGKALKTQSACQCDAELSLSRSSVTISLETPYPYDRVLKDLGAIDDVMAGLLLLDRTPADEPDFDQHEELTERLLDRYWSSKEYRSAKAKFNTASLIVDFGFNYTYCTVATLSPSDLEEILYSWIPRKVMVGPDEAASIIKDAKTFLKFLHRAYKLDRAKRCLIVLGKGSTERLRDALASPDNFGMAKSMFSSSDDLL